MGFVLGIDVGGTFTDCVALAPDRSIRIAKSLSTGPDFHIGFVDSIEAIANQLGISTAKLLADTDSILHGCTVGANALVERRFARTGLLTTQGHRDSLAAMKAGRRMVNMPAEEIARVADHRKPEPLIAPELIRELDERIGADGAVVVGLDESQVRVAVQELIDAGVEGIAVSLLWSAANPAHETAVAAIIRDMAPQLYVSVSSVLAPKIGEYERTVATVVNGLIGPEMIGYLSNLQQQCRDSGYHGDIRIMTVSGGLISVAEAQDFPVLTIGCGPVAGLIGAHRLGMSNNELHQGTADSNAVNIITADMGGTTLDVGVIHHGEPLRRPTSWYGQYEYFVPTLDVRSIGSGGGSIIRYDELTRTLKVGPESAGSRPGPVCYGRGGLEPTVTDADLVAGFLAADNFAGGRMLLDFDAAERALAEVGQPLGLTAAETAAAALRIVDNQMADEIRRVSVQQGLDPREFTLYACGGAGAVHAAAIVSEVGMREIVVPLSDLAAGWSAFGVAGAEPLVVQEAAQPMKSPFDPARMNTMWSELESTATQRLLAQGVTREDVVLSRHVDVRYSRQVNEIEVDAPDGVYGEHEVNQIILRFETEYERLFGEGSGVASAGFATSGMRVRGRSSRPDAGTLRVNEQKPATEAPEPLRYRDVTFHTHGPKALATPIFGPAAVHTGVHLDGPAIIELPDTSIVVPPKSRYYVDAQGSAHIAPSIDDQKEL